AEFRAAVHLSLGRSFGTVREPVDVVLHQALRSVVPVWADGQLAEQASRPTRRERDHHAADQYHQDTLEYAIGDDSVVSGVADDGRQAPRSTRLPAPPHTAIGRAAPSLR